jgi:hypothetical protein
MAEPSIVKARSAKPEVRQEPVLAGAWAAKLSETIYWLADQYHPSPSGSVLAVPTESQ